MSDINDHNPEVYWEVDGIRYKRKSDALIASSNNNKSPVKFYYYNDRFNLFDWSKEPVETFQELATQRAYQLRETNKYIRLWYSGGADSHTMLQAFLVNNIPLDEIVMVRTSPINIFDDVTANREENARSFPYIKSIQYQIPKTKISIVDVTAEQYLEYYKNPEWHLETLCFDFSDDPGLLIGSRKNIEKHTNLTMKPGTVEITGGDKPKIVRRNGIYYAPIVDVGFQYLYWANVRDFYTTPEFPALHSKQCHVLKNVINKWYPEGDVTHEIYNPATIDRDFKKDWYKCCRDIINYDMDYGKGWTIFSPKNKLRIQLATEHNPELYKCWVGSLRDLKSQIPQYWENFEDLIPGVISGIYCLGK